MRRIPIAFLLAAVAIAGCGGGGGSDDAGGADPAKVVPAATAIYVEARLRPGGEVGSEARAALAKVLRTDDPIAKIARIVDREAGSGDLGFRDLDRWVGARAAVFVPRDGLTAGTPPFGFAIASKDDTLARRVIEREARRDRGRSGTYRDVTYWTDVDDGTVVGVTDGWVIGGSLREFRRAVDALEGGAALAGEDRLDRTRDEVDADEAVGFAALDLRAVRDAVGRGLAGSSQPDIGVDKIFDRLGTDLAMALTATSKGISSRVALIGGDLSSASSGSPETLAELPAQAWLALHLGRLDRNALEEGLDQLPAAGRRELSDALAAIRRETGVDVERDLLSWMGDAAIVVSGATVEDLGVALTVTSRDGDRSVEAVGKIEALIRRLAPPDALQLSRTDLPGYDDALRVRVSGFDRPLFVAANDERFVIGVGDGLIAQIASPAMRLGDSRQFERARSLLGDDVEPSMIVDVPELLRLIGSVGSVASDAGFRRAKPYLDAYGTIAIGGEADDDVAEGVAVVGLR